MSAQAVGLEHEFELEERRARVARLVPHEVAAWFPLLAEDRLQELAADIAAHGLREPLWVLGDVLLDGRNRRAACELAGVVPDVVEFAGPAESIPAWIISKNLHRRHLDTSQRAMLAARLKGSWAKLPTDQRPAGALREAAAERLNVSPRTVTTAEQVLEAGDPELVRRVDAGELTVSRAAADLDRAGKLELARELLTETNPGALELRRVLDAQAPRKVRAAVRTERRPNDAYYTPIVVAAACMSIVGPIARGARVLEPSVGGGAWAAQVPAHAELTVIDVDPSASGLELAGERSIVGDFLTHDFGPARFDLVVGNPPFGDAEAHVRRALQLLGPGGRLFFLLRRNWIAAARFAFLEEGLAPAGEWVLGPRRVSFTGDADGLGGTDMQEYSLFEWRHGSRRASWLTATLRWMSDRADPNVSGGRP